MAMQTDPCFVGGTQIIIGTLGASVFPTKIVPPAGCVAMQFKLMTAGATLQILPNAISGLNIAGATSITGLLGYPMPPSTTEAYPFYGPSSFYFAATGATATVAANFMYSATGATLS